MSFKSFAAVLYRSFICNMYSCFLRLVDFLLVPRACEELSCASLREAVVLCERFKVDESEAAAVGRKQKTLKTSREEAEEEEKKKLDVIAKCE